MCKLYRSRLALVDLSLASLFMICFGAFRVFLLRNAVLPKLPTPSLTLLALLWREPSACSDAKSLAISPLGAKAKVVLGL